MRKIIFKYLLDNSKKQDKERLYSYLEDVEKNNLSFLPSLKKKLDVKDFLLNDLIDTVHYSWFLPIMKIYPEDEANLFLLSLNKEQKKSIQKNLNIKANEDVLNKEAKFFFKSLLLKSLIKKEDSLLPLDYLPDSEMNILLNFTKAKLVDLIDLMSMYDLAKELKMVVMTSSLKKIHSYLSEREKIILKKANEYKDPINSKNLMLERYLDDKAMFRSALHKRGLVRLSLALSLENIDLIWYICHYLDIGRGSFIFNESKKNKNPNIATVLKKQVLDIVKTFK